MKVQILTQEKIVTELEADSITIPTESGEITVLTGHIPLFSKLRAGQLTIRSGKQEELLAVIGGFVDISPNMVKVLTDTAIKASEIDVLQAQKAINDAKRAMKDKQSGIDFTQATRDLGRAMLELETVNRWRKLKNIH
mgnify:FL=1